MAVTIVIDADLVRSRTSLPDDAAVVAAIESAIEGACIFLESFLTSFFKKTSRVDYFLVDKARYVDEPPDGMVRLKLKAGFVRATPAVVIKSAGSFTDLKADVDTEIVASADYHLDSEKGILSLDADDFDKLYVSVAYDSGFSGDTDTSIPDWLKEAALAYTITVLNHHQTTNRAPEMKVIAEEARMHAASVASPNNRNLVPFTLLPLV